MYIASTSTEKDNHSAMETKLKALDTFVSLNARLPLSFFCCPQTRATPVRSGARLFLSPSPENTLIARVTRWVMAGTYCRRHGWEAPSMRVTAKAVVSFLLIIHIFPPTHTYESNIYHSLCLPPSARTQQQGGGGGRRGGRGEGSRKGRPQTPQYRRQATGANEEEEEKESPPLHPYPRLLLSRSSLSSSSSSSLLAHAHTSGKISAKQALLALLLLP